MRSGVVMRADGGSVDHNLVDARKQRRSLWSERETGLGSQTSRSPGARRLLGGAVLMRREATRTASVVESAGCERLAGRHQGRARARRRRLLLT